MGTSMPSVPKILLQIRKRHLQSHLQINLFKYSSLATLKYKGMLSALCVRHKRRGGWPHRKIGCKIGVQPPT